MNLHQQSYSNNIYGIGKLKVNLPGTLVKLVVKPVGKLVPIISTAAVVMYSLTGDIPSYHVNCKGKLDLSNIQLADQSFDQAQDVHIILGTDIINYVLDGAKISLNIPGLAAYGTCFGHVIMGTVSSTHHSSVKVSVSQRDRSSSVQDYGLLATRLEDVLERF